MKHLKSESGRSMVEMLGVLAIIGVLSIGGIMGYSYAMDKYRANQTMNDVNLRAIDLIAQASRRVDFTLAEWPTKSTVDYDIGLEVDTATNTTEGGIYVNKVPQNVCEIIADLVSDDIELTINGTDKETASCADENKMVFYYGAIDDALGKTCAGPIVDGECEPCESPRIWDGTTCACPGETVFVGDTKTCEPCPSTATYSNGTCICGGSWHYYSSDNVCSKIERPTHATDPS